MYKLLKSLVISSFFFNPLLSAQDSGNMSFFVTSKGLGKGANLGGLQGADQHCQSLAASVGAGGKIWRAYLSTNEIYRDSAMETGSGHHDVNGVTVWDKADSKTAIQGEIAVNARDRIGSGPWYNAKGILIAKDINDLHSDLNKINKENALTESGELVNGQGDRPNMHDILTGSMVNGMSFPGNQETTCRNWTNNRPGSSAVVGHHDRIQGDYYLGGGDIPTSWNSSHYTLGCGQTDLQKAGGGGLFYCFATE